MIRSALNFYLHIPKSVFNFVPPYIHSMVVVKPLYIR